MYSSGPGWKCRLRVGVCKTPLRRKPHDIRNCFSDWIQEDRLLDAGPKQALEGLNKETNLPERRDTKSGL